MYLLCTFLFVQRQEPDMGTLQQTEAGGSMTPGVREQPGQRTKAWSPNENKSKSICDCSKIIFMTTP